MIHTCAFYGSVPANTEHEIDVIPDDVLTRTANTRFMVPADYARIASAVTYTDTNGPAPLVYTPSLEVRRLKKRIIPINAINDDGKTVNYDRKPVTLVPTEEISVIVKNTSTSASRPCYVFLNLGTFEPVEAEDVIIVKASGSTTLVANQWTSVKIVPEIQLEAGSYQLLGFIPISANCIYARVLITGQVARPGYPGIKASDDYDLKIEEFEERYPFQNCGVFPHTAIPEFQFLASSADSSEIVYMFLRKV